MGTHYGPVVRYPTMTATLAELDARPDERVRMHFPVTAGLLVRRQARFLLRVAEADDALDVRWLEEAGILTSWFDVRVAGPGRKVARLLRDLMSLGG